MEAVLFVIVLRISVLKVTEDYKYSTVHFFFQNITFKILTLLSSRWILATSTLGLFVTQHALPIYSQSTTNKMRLFSMYLFLQDALHASDGFSVHHQELKTAHTASGICQTDTVTCCYLARLAAGNSIGLTNTWPCMCNFELLMMDAKAVWNM